MEERRGRPYFRLGRAERAAIERGLDGRESGRGIARSLGRSNATVSDEVRRNRTVAKGPGKGGRVEGVPEHFCTVYMAYHKKHVHSRAVTDFIDFVKAYPGNDLIGQVLPEAAGE